MTTFTLSHVLPMSALTWPKTAEEARRFVDERNAEARANRQRRDAERAAWERDLDAMSTKLRDLGATRTTARTMSAPARPGTPARGGLNPVEIYRALNARPGLTTTFEQAEREAARERGVVAERPSARRRPGSFAEIARDYYGSAR